LFSSQTFEAAMHHQQFCLEKKDTCAASSGSVLKPKQKSSHKPLFSDALVVIKFAVYLDTV